MTPILYSYNSLNHKFCPVIIGDHPRINNYERIASNTEIKQLKKMFNTHLEELKKENFEFRPELLTKHTFVDARLLYFTEVIRQACHSSKKMVVVAEQTFIDQIVNNWKSLPQEIRPIDSFYAINNETHDSLSFVDYIEKIVLIDLLTDNFIKDNFVAYKVYIV